MSSPLHDLEQASPEGDRSGISRRDLLVLGALGLAVGVPRSAGAEPQGQMIWGVHVSLAPTWFDPAETPGVITPFMIMYALHDALVKPMPDQGLAPSLAESWSTSEDGLTYEFVLRKDAKFHNGEPVSAEDVKFSFERYRGTSHDMMKERVASIEVPDPQHVRFKLKAPWPDFLTFYGSATGAGWVVPKKYVEKVGDDGFKRAPIGAGPYKFVSFSAGVELVLEAFDPYWRKAPRVKRLILKVIPDETTRLAALKGGEVDVIYSIRGELASDLRKTPGLTLKPTVVLGAFHLNFPDQWDPKSPWHDQRVRKAASLAIDRTGTNDALTLGYSKITGSMIPYNFDFFWQPPMPEYDPGQAKKLLVEAGYPNGLTPAVTIAILLMLTWPKRSSTLCLPSASGRNFGRWSGPLSSQDMVKRSSRTSFNTPAAPLAMPPLASKPSLPRAAPMSMAVTLTSMNSFNNRVPCWIIRSGKQSCTRSNS